MMAYFGNTLERLRTQAGFATAYAYYHRNGGRRVFPFSFSYYRKIERGLSLPKASWLPVLIHNLRLLTPAEGAQALAKALLRDLVGDDAVFRDFVEPLFAPVPASPPDHKAVRRFLTAGATQLTVEQCRTIYADAAAYWAFYCLSERRGPLTVAELSAATGQPAVALRAAAVRLVHARLFKRAGKDSFLCPFAGSHTITPYGYPGWGEDNRRRLEYAAGVPGGGVPYFDMHGVGRADAMSQAEMARILSEALEKCAAFSQPDDAQPTPMVHVRASVTRLFDY
jgi:hypothetical protein